MKTSPFLATQAASLLIGLSMAGCATSSKSVGVATNGLSFDYEDMKPGSMPADWKVDATKPTPVLATWAVEEATGGGHIFSLTSPNHAEKSSYNLCWSHKIAFQDGTLSVRLRSNTGEVDQGGGLIWRARDANNYYIARYNPLESNLRVYYVKEGKREMLQDAPFIDVPAGTWIKLDVTHKGDHITVAQDGNTLLDVHDSTFPDAGGVGLWTKADAATSFDDLVVTPAP